MQLDLSAPKVITFSIAVVVALIAFNYSLRPSQCPLDVTTGFTILFGRIFCSGCRKRLSRTIGEKERIVKGRGPKPSLAPWGRD